MQEFLFVFQSKEMIRGIFQGLEGKNFDIVLRAVSSNVGWLTWFTAASSVTWRTVTSEVAVSSLPTGAAIPARVVLTRWHWKET